MVYDHIRSTHTYFQLSSIKIVNSIYVAVLPPIGDCKGFGGVRFSPNYILQQVKIPLAFELKTVIFVKWDRFCLQIPPSERPHWSEG